MQMQFKPNNEKNWRFAELLRKIFSENEFEEKGGTARQTKNARAQRAQRRTRMRIRSGHVIDSAHWRSLWGGLLGFVAKGFQDHSATNRADFWHTPSLNHLQGLL